MKHTKKYFRAYLYLLFLSWALGACKREYNEVLPDGQRDIRVNYYSASDVLKAIGNNVDVSVYADSLYQQHTRAFRLESGINWIAFPRTYQYSDDSQISYARYVAQPYRFVFGGDNAPLADTLLDLKPTAFHCIYLADAPTAQNSPPQYRILAVTEERGGIPEGQTGVRFINLSPETNAVQVNLIQPGGMETALTKVAYLQASDYRQFKQEDTQNGMLRLRLQDDTDGSTLYTAVPFSAGRSYVVIIQGFKNEQTRQVTAQNGIPGISTVTIPSNLRVTVRRTY